jgi:hypothetical protein
MRQNSQSFGLRRFRLYQSPVEPGRQKASIGPSVTELLPAAESDRLAVRLFNQGWRSCLTGRGGSGSSSPRPRGAQPRWCARDRPHRSQRVASDPVTIHHPTRRCRQFCPGGWLRRCRRAQPLLRGRCFTPSTSRCCTQTSLVGCGWSLGAGALPRLFMQTTATLSVLCVGMCALWVRRSWPRCRTGSRSRFCVRQPRGSAPHTRPLC